MNREECEKHIQMLQYAYENSIYYQEKIKEAGIVIDDYQIERKWDEIPMLTKEELISHKRLFMSQEYYGALYNEHLESMFTSGSTGSCLEVLWEPAQMKHSLTKLWMMRYREFGIKPHDRYCYFFSGRENEKRGIEYETVNEFALGICKSNLTEERLVDIYNKIRTFEPKWTVIQPSMAELLVRVKEKYNLPKVSSLVYIELTGETIQSGLRKKLKTVFECEVRSQYGCNEVMSIAYECKKGNLHCMEENVFVEVLDENGKQLEHEEGNIYVTTLNNYVMPFIRYQVGDRGKWSLQKCTCGCSGRVLELLSGRTSDVAYLADGGIVSGYVFYHTIYLINEKTDYCIRQYQIVQKEEKLFLIRLVVDDDFGEQEICDMFMGHFYEPQLADATFQFEFCDSILPDKETGKVRCFLPIK